MSNNRFLCLCLVLAILLCGVVTPMFQPQMVVATVPNTPWNTEPDGGALTSDLSPRLVASPFWDSEGHTFVASRWQIRTSDGDYSSPVYDTVETSYQNSYYIYLPSGLLNYSTTYYWHVRYQDSTGVWSNWSSETSFTTVTLPSVTTNAATDVSATLATLNLTLTSVGSNPFVVVDFEWGLTTSYGGGTTAGTMDAPGTFSAGLEGLTASTTYHYRAAASGWGTGYGNDMTFTTDAFGPPEVTTTRADRVAATTATVEGYLVSMGTESSVTVSVVYGTTPGGPYPLEATGQVLTSSNDPHFYVDLTGLSPGITYYCRAKAIGNGTGYGNEISFTTIATLTPPSVTTLGGSAIDATTAGISQDLTSMGSATTVDVLFEWGLTTAYGNTTTPLSRGSLGTYTFTLTGLTPNTTYHFRAVAVGDGTGYGDDMSFITPTPTTPTPPSVTTSAATSVTFASARLSGSLASLGTAFTVYVTFQYGTVSGSYAYETPYQERTSAGTFVADIYGLPGTTYYYRAKAVAIGIGTSNGDEMSFTTETPPPGSNCWAVIVGVADYEFVSDLRYPDDDAQELYNLLTPVWGEDHVRLLLNAQATKSAIQSAISSWLAPLEDADDTVLLFFSGHGGYLTYDQPPIDEADGRDEYIVPHDARYVEDMILDDELNSWLSGLESARQVAIIDSCYSGGFIGGDFARDLSKAGRVVITATEEAEVGWETSDLGHCVFPYYLLDGFEHLDVLDADGNNDISAEELFAYAQPRTTEYETTHDYESIQHPQIYDGYAGELGLINLATLTIDASARVTSLTLDGQTYSPPDLPVSVDFLQGTNRTFTFSVATTIDDGVQQTKYTFLSWDDGVTSGTRTVDISGSTSYVADYKTQYYLTVQSERGNPQGTGWYDQGSTAQFSVDSIVNESHSVRCLFDGWSDNSIGTNNPSSVLMDSPKTITAIWRTQYKLTINTSPLGMAAISAEGWYDKGASVTTAAASATIDAGLGTHYVFSSWSVDGTQVSGNPITVKMDSAHAVTALYTTQYELTALSDTDEIQGSGWYDGGTEVCLSADATSQGTSGTRYVFSSWSVDGMQVSGNPITVKMDSAHAVTALYTTQYELTVLSDAGETQGSGWYNAGSEANISVGASSGIIVRRVFARWRGDSSLKTRNATVVTDGPKTIEALWRTDYTQLYILLGGILLVALVALAVIILVPRRQRPARLQMQPPGIDA